MSVDNLKLLEVRLEAFLVHHQRALQEQESLAQRLRERDEQLEEAAAKLKEYEQERAEVLGRLDRLLARLSGLDLS